MQLAIAGQANIIYHDLIAKATGNAITSGTVSFYLLAKSGANAGKWFDTSDDSWQAAEAVAGTGTHKADGHWLSSIDSAAWISGVKYSKYAKESGDLHIAYSEDITCEINSDILAKALAYTQLMTRKDSAINSDNATELTAINADGGSGAGDFDNQTDAEQAIRDAVTAASPQSHSATADNITTGTRDGATTYTNTLTIDASYFQTSPVTPAVGGFGLNIDLTFTVGTGLSRVPNSVNIAGYFDSGGQRKVHVWVYNYLTSSWNQLSDNGSAMSNESSTKDYQHSLQNAHIQTSDGEVQIRFTSTSVTAGDDLYLDFVSVNSIAVEAAGLTTEAIANAVASHDVSEHTDHNSFGFRAAQSIIDDYPITTSNTSLSFTCSSLPAITNYYRNYRVRIHDFTNDRYADSWIASMDNAGVVILGSALPFTPDTSAELYIMAYAHTAEMSASEFQAALLAIVGITEGGTMTLQKLLKIQAAWIAGNWQDKSGSDTIKELLDADDASTVILEMTLSETTPQRTISIQI